ncbi:hypothetical protein BC826DRAFT_679958 [Russula brevipes]|nr:hypothetical protein BC826DRAFT_679958 [Russula brevipes]
MASLHAAAARIRTVTFSCFSQRADSRLRRVHVPARWHYALRRTQFLSRAVAEAPRTDRRPDDMDDLSLRRERHPRKGQAEIICKCSPPHFSTTSLSYTVVAAPLIAAAVPVSYPMRVLSPLPARFQPQWSGVHDRQLLVPPECFPVCDPITTTIEECLDAECACTSGNMNALFSCVECTVAVWQTNEGIASGQATLDNFAGKCAAEGIPLAVPTVTASTELPPLP